MIRNTLKNKELIKEVGRAQCLPTRDDHTRKHNLLW